jgi:hypothetical protein
MLHMLIVDGLEYTYIYISYICIHHRHYMAISFIITEIRIRDCWRTADTHTHYRLRRVIVTHWYSHTHYTILHIANKRMPSKPSKRHRTSLITHTHVIGDAHYAHGRPLLRICWSWLRWYGKSSTRWVIWLPESVTLLPHAIRPCFIWRVPHSISYALALISLFSHINIHFIWIAEPWRQLDNIWPLVII